MADNPRDIHDSGFKPGQSHLRTLQEFRDLQF